MSPVYAEKVNITKTPNYLTDKPMYAYPTIPVNAGEVNITEIPQALSDKMGIPLFAGQLLCSGILLFLFLLPLAVLTRKRGASWLAELIVGFVIMGVCIALQWLPYWFLIILSVLIALMFAGKMRGWITGGHR